MGTHIFTRSRILVSALLIATLLAGQVQGIPNTFGLYEYDELNNSNNPNNMLNQEMPIRLQSELLDLAGLSYNPTAVRVMIAGKGDVSSISEDVHVAHHLKTRDGFIAFAATTSEKLPLLTSQGFTVTMDPRLEFDQKEEVKDASRLSQILGSDNVREDAGLTGKGIKIAVVDTGTDFSNEDLKHALARDANGRPIMIDADGQGIVLTRTKFIANITPQGNLLNSTETSDEDENEFVSNVYFNDDGVFLKLNRGENGTRFEVYNSIYPLLSPLLLNATSNKDWKIGLSNTNFIKSMSGEYHMGFALQVQFHLGRAGLIIVPVLVVDNRDAGVYDTIVADMSSAWADFSKFELSAGGSNVEFDYDFTDESKIKLGRGNEFLIYDEENDGDVDLTAGMVGAHVLDIWGVMEDEGEALIEDYVGAVNGTLLQPLDTNGTYFGVMFDFLGHGTGSAGSIASRGQDTYDVYNNSTEFSLKGAAPDAKIIPVKALWFGDIVYGWFWISGFDQDASGNWTYSGAHKADVVNNSWGVSTFPVLDYGPGYDILSALASVLSVPGSIDPDFPGVLMVSSAGNTGFGYGTLGAPSSPFSLTVGATTNNVFVGASFTKKEPRFGNSTLFYDDVAEFSSRGPNMLGDVKPEVMSVGAYGFVPMPPNSKHAPNATGAFGIFGGTSMSAPLVSGAAAVAMQGLRENNVDIDPFLVKSILMSTASDLGHDPLTQGAGKADISNLVPYLEGEEGRFLVYTEDTYANMVNLLQGPVSKYELTGLGNYSLSFPDKDLPASKWYAGYINKDREAEAEFMVTNPANATLSVEIEPTMLKLIKQHSFNSTTDVRQKDPIMNETESGYVPNYFNLNKEMEIPDDTEIMVIKSYFPFESFLNSTEPIYADSLRIASLYVYDWNDANDDKEVWFNETSLVNRGGSWGTVQEVTVRDPLDRIKNTPLLGIYPVPTIFSYWNGNTNQNTTAMNYTLVANFYKKETWERVSVDTTSLEIEPGGNATFTAAITVPDDTVSGIYQGFITVKSGSQVSNIPVSFVVPVTVSSKDTPVVVSGEPRGDLLYDNAAFSGSFDMVSRYNAGEWRFYHFNVTDPTMNAMNLKISWRNNMTSVNTMVTDPDGRIVASSVPAGVFKVFLGWASNDWLGSTRFSEGGGFYRSQNHGENSTVLYVPVNSTGIYSIMLHATLFHGKSLTEPLIIEAKSTTLLPDTMPPKIMLEFPEYARGVVGVPVVIEEENIEDASFSVDGSPPVSLKENATMIVDTTELTEGFHHLTVSATDVVGHRVFKDIIFVADNTEPQLGVRSPADGIVVSDKFEVNLEVSDSSLQTYGVLLPNGTMVENLKKFTADTSALGDGEYSVVITAEDGAGNVAEVTRSIRVDKAIPHVAILNPAQDATVYGEVDVMYEVADDNLKSVTLTVGEKSIEIENTGSYSLDTTTLFDGEYALQLTAEDMAGNTGSEEIGIVAANHGASLMYAQLLGIAIGIAIGAGAAAVIITRINKNKNKKEEPIVGQQQGL